MKHIHSSCSSNNTSEDTDSSLICGQNGRMHAFLGR